MDPLGSTSCCRICLKQTDNDDNLYDGNFPDIIQSLTGIKIKEDNSININKCCDVCVKEVKFAYIVQQRIIRSDKKLRIKLGSSETEAEIVQTEKGDGQNQIIEQVKHLESIEVTKVQNTNKNDNVVYLENNSNDAFFFKDEECLNDYNRLDDDDDDDDDLSHVSVKSEDIEDEEQENGNMTKIVNNNGKSDQCYIKLFSHESTFTEKETENITKIEIRNYECNFCDEVFDNKFSYSRHKPKHINKEYKCSFCDSVFDNKFIYMRHRAKHIKRTCETCGTTVRADNFSKHVQSHKSGPMVCDFCGATCKNMESLRGHIFYIHKKTDNEYKCDDCGKEFKKRYKYILHRQKEHIGIRNHVCETCGKGFFTQQDLSKHYKSTHLKLRPHICTYCDRGFSSKYALKTHIRQHTNETPFKCDICGTGFRQRVSLKTHMKSKHNIQENTMFDCTYCDKSFASDHALRVHLRLHTDGKIKCSLCTKVFTQRSVLIDHLNNDHPDVIGSDEKNVPSLVKG